MKKIWICGAYGMLGSHFQRELYGKNVSFVPTRRTDIDITNLDQILEFVKREKITHIINCAAYTAVDKAEIEQEEAYKINSIGPYHLGIAGKKFHLHVLHFSTDYVFSGTANRPLLEDEPCSPIGVYGKSKWEGEQKLLNEHPHASVVRTSWLFGYPGKNFVDTMVRLMQEKEHLKVVVDQIGRPTFCKDLVEASMQLLDEEGIFHFANSFETSWYQFAKEIRRQALQLGFSLAVKNIEPIPSIDYPTLAKRPFYSTLNTTKMEAILGREPRPWQEALHEHLILNPSFSSVSRL